MCIRDRLVAFDNGVFSVVASNYEAMCSTIISANGLTGLANGWFGLPLLAGVSLFFNQMCIRDRYTITMFIKSPFFKIHSIMKKNASYAHFQCKIRKISIFFKTHEKLKLERLTAKSIIFYFYR